MNIHQVLACNHRSICFDRKQRRIIIVSITEWEVLATGARLTFGFFSFTVTGSHSTVSSMVSTIMFIIQFNFFFRRPGLESLVSRVSAELALDLISASVCVVSLARVPSIISSGIDSLTLRFCQNIYHFNTSGWYYFIGYCSCVSPVLFIH